MSETEDLIEVFNTELQGSLELAHTLKSRLFISTPPKNYNGNLYSFTASGREVVIENLFDEEETQIVTTIIFKEILDTYIGQLG